MLDPISFIKTREEMHVALDAIYTMRKQKPSLKALIALSSFELNKLPFVASTERRLRKSKIEMNQLDDNLYRVSISKEMPKGGPVKGQVLIDVHDEAWVLLTTGRTYFLRHAIDSLLKTLYPQVSRVYLNHYTMLEVLNKIKQKYGGSKVVTAFSAYTEEERGERYGRKSVRITGKSAEKDLRSLSHKQRIWLNKVAYQVDDPKGTNLVESVIYSSGLSRLVFGNFTDFYRNVLGTIMETTEELDSKYRQVRREDVDDHPVLKPCVLQYEGAFQQAHIESLAKNLTRDYAISVTHTGNPYFAAEILDPEEGSSFGLTLHESVVTVTPMLRSTGPALWRLTTNIQTVLGEGVLSVP